MWTYYIFFSQLVYQVCLCETGQRCCFTGSLFLKMQRIITTLPSGSWFQYLHNWRPHICHINTRQCLKESLTTKGVGCKSVVPVVKSALATLVRSSKETGGEHDPRPSGFPKESRKHCAVCNSRTLTWIEPTGGIMSNLWSSHRTYTFCCFPLFICCFGLVDLMLFLFILLFCLLFFFFFLFLINWIFHFVLQHNIVFVES